MASDTNQQVKDLGLRLAQAQQRGDADALELLLADDFRLVGPLGFVLDKQQWLEQFRSGALVVRSLVWEEVDVRDYGEAAIAIGRQTQQANYRGQPADGSFRVTQVAIRRGHRWALAGLHLSAITQPQAPASPGSANGSAVACEDGGHPSAGCCGAGQPARRRGEGGSAGRSAGGAAAPVRRRRAGQRPALRQPRADAGAGLQSWSESSSFPGCGHCTQQERPTDVTRELVAFLGHADGYGPAP